MKNFQEHPQGSVYRTLRSVFDSMILWYIPYVRLHLIQKSQKYNPTMPTNPSLLRHVVVFKFKEGTTPAQIAEIEEAFRALPAKIDVIHDFEWGTNVSKEKSKLNLLGFTHCFFLTFKSEADLEAYLPHPDHELFKDLVGPYLESVLVSDYWAKV